MRGARIAVRLCPGNEPPTKRDETRDVRDKTNFYAWAVPTAAPTPVAVRVGFFPPALLPMQLNYFFLPAKNNLSKLFPLVALSEQSEGREPKARGFI